MTTTLGFSYWQDTRSANKNPTCRRGGCGVLAQPDSEWCAQCGQVVAQQQADANAVMQRLADRYNSISVRRERVR